MNSDINQPTNKEITKSYGIETKENQSTVISNLTGELIQSIRDDVLNVNEVLKYNINTVPKIGGNSDDVSLTITISGTPLMVGKACARIEQLFSNLEEYIKASL